MATLQQLIDNGLQVGQLVCGEEWPLSVAQWDGEFLISVANDGWHLEGDTIFSDGLYWQLTTTHDSGIDPDVLPIEEPFATGWVVTSDGYKFEPIPYEKQSKWFTDGWHQDYYKSQCRPCLPPKTVEL